MYLTTSMLYLLRSGFDVLVFFMLLYVSLITVMVAMLGCYHSQLLAANLTTNEHHNLWRYDYFRGPNGLIRNPFDAGCWRNCVSRLVWVHSSDTPRPAPQQPGPDEQPLLETV